MRFHPDLPTAQFEPWAQSREETYQQLVAWFGGGPTDRVRLIVWPSSAVAEAAGLPPLGYTHAKIDLIQTRVDQTRGHELTHEVLQHALHPVAFSPLVNEGIAVLLDGTNRDRMKEARRSVQAAGAPAPRIAEAWALTRSRGLDYAVAGAFVGMLLERGGKERLLALLADQTQARAAALYGAELEGWIAEFEAGLE